jgi:predicted transcriptional regulator
MRTPSRKLIETIVAEEPASIQELADAVDRDYRGWLHAPMVILKAERLISSL